MKHCFDVSVSLLLFCCCSSFVGVHITSYFRPYLQTYSMHFRSVRSFSRGVKLTMNNVKHPDCLNCVDLKKDIIILFSTLLAFLIDESKRIWTY